MNKHGEPPPLMTAPRPIILPRESAPSPGTLTLLHKKEQSADSGYGEFEEADLSHEPSTSSQSASTLQQWVNAAEFIPGQPWKASSESMLIEQNIIMELN